MIQTLGQKVKAVKLDKEKILEQFECYGKFWICKDKKNLESKTQEHGTLKAILEIVRDKGTHSIKKVR